MTRWELGDAGRIRPGARTGERALLAFDLDGCLIDSAGAITGAVSDTLRTVGVAPPPIGSLTWCVGPPLRESLERLLVAGGADPGLAPRCIDHYRERYAATWQDGTTVVEGVPTVLAAASAAGARLAVVTSKPGPVAVPILTGLGLAGWFEAVYAPEADHGNEPKRVSLQQALDELLPEGPPRRATMIGDRSHDVDAGRACGTATVGVTWGAGDRCELASAGADEVVDSPDELAAVLGTAVRV